MTRDLRTVRQTGGAKTKRRSDEPPRIDGPVIGIDLGTTYSSPTESLTERRRVVDSADSTLDRGVGVGVELSLVRREGFLKEGTPRAKSYQKNI